MDAKGTNDQADEALDVDELEEGHHVCALCANAGATEPHWTVSAASAAARVSLRLRILSVLDEVDGGGAEQGRQAGGEGCEVDLLVEVGVPCGRPEERDAPVTRTPRSKVA
jgi:hypothetical protein